MPVNVYKLFVLFKTNNLRFYILTFVDVGFLNYVFEYDYLFCSMSVTLIYSIMELLIFV